MKLVAYILWVLSAPFFGGGLFWMFVAAVAPMWVVAVGMIVHLCVWGSVTETLTENGWDN